MTAPLSLPVVSPRPGGWSFTWGSEEVSLSLERLRESRDSITGELWVSQGEPAEHLLGGIRFSLVTPTGRASIIKALTARRNGVDWGGMIEQVCVYSLRKLQEEEAMTCIGDLPIESSLSFRLAPVIPEGVTTLLFGYGGMAKTTIAICWGLIVQTGFPLLGLVPKPAPVLLLDWETNREIANRVQSSLHAGIGMEGKPFFFYRRCRRPLIEFVEYVKADVKREGVGLVILDSLAKACGGEREIKENALLTMNALEWLGSTNLVVTHRPKGEAGRERGPYGSVFVENDARQAFRVEARHSPESNTSNVAIFHTKYNLMSPLPPIGYLITWDQTLGTKIELAPIASMEELGSMLRIVDQIANLLKEEQMTPASIAEELNLKEATVRQTLNRYKNKRFIPLLAPPGSPTLWGLSPPKDANNDHLLL